MGTRSTRLNGENVIAQTRTRSMSTTYARPWLRFVRAGENLHPTTQLLQSQVRGLLTWTRGAQCKGLLADCRSFYAGPRVLRYLALPWIAQHEIHPPRLDTSYFLAVDPFDIPLDMVITYGGISPHTRTISLPKGLHIEIRPVNAMLSRKGPQIPTPV